MDKDQRHAAIELHSVLADHLAPHYAELRDIFNSELELSGRRGNDLRGERPDGRFNHEMILDFVSTLPAVANAFVPYEVGHRLGYIIGSKDMDIALMQQAAMVFYTPHTYSNGYTGASRPYYVIGMSKGSNELLLAAPTVSQTEAEIDEDTQAYPAAESLLIASPHLPDRMLRMNHRKNEAKIQAQFDTAVSGIDGLSAFRMTNLTAYTDTIFNPRTGNFEISFDTEGSKELVVVNDPSHYDVPAYTKSKLNFISDEDLARFNVIEHLSLLATMFGKDGELIAAFSDDTPERIPPKKVQRALTFAATKVQAPFNQ